MTGPHAIVDSRIRIPASAFDPDGFNDWLHSGQFPDTGRVDFLEGDVEVETSSEELLTHGAVKMAVASALHQLMADEGLGEVFVTRTRVSLPEARLSVEPDVVGILWSSIREGRLRYQPSSSQRKRRYEAIQGPPDMVVEVVSDASLRKDTSRLPELYAKAGIREYWLVDAREPRVFFRILSLKGDRYEAARDEKGGWQYSPTLERWFRIVREKTPAETWRYRLERAP